MVAPRVTSWATALRTPLMLSQAHGRHARRAGKAKALPFPPTASVTDVFPLSHLVVKLRLGVRLVFDGTIKYAFYRALARIVYTLCTLQFTAFVVICAYAIAAFIAAVLVLAFLEEIPHHGLLTYRVRIRLYHPLLEWLSRGIFKMR